MKARSERLLSPKKIPKHRKGYSIVMHLSKTEVEQGDDGKLYFKCLGYSYRKTKPYYETFTEEQLLAMLNKELKKYEKETA